MDFGVNSLPIPEFNGKYYEYWALKMKHLLIGKGVWDIIEDGYVELDWATLPQVDGTAKREAQKKNSYLLPSSISLVQEVISKYCKLQHNKGCLEGLEGWVPWQ